MARWGPRDGTLRPIAERLCSTLVDLAAIEDGFDDLCFACRSQRGRPFSPTVDAAERALVRNRLKDGYRRVMANGGSSLSLRRQGPRGWGWQFDAFLGVDRWPLFNYLEVRFPCDPLDGDGQTVIDETTLGRTLSLLIRQWTPDWAAAGVRDQIAYDRTELNRPGLAWMTWLPTAWGAPPALDSNWSSSRFADGTLLILGSDFRAVHVEALEKSRARLVQAGFLPPPLPRRVRGPRSLRRPMLALPASTGDPDRNT